MDDKREIKVENEAYKKFDNFWYYHKWHVIVGIVLIFAIVVCTVQACSREKEDIKIIYAGPSFIDTEAYNELSNTFNSVLPEDFDGDGKKNVGLVRYQIYSQEEIEEQEQIVLPDGTQNVVDKAQNSSNMSSYSSYLMTGDVSVCFLSEYLFENLKKNDRLMPLSEIFEEVPESACDEYGIRLSAIDFYKYNSSVRAMDGDTVICLLRQTVVGASKNDKEYKKAVDTFKSIVGFKIIEE